MDKKQARKRPFYKKKRFIIPFLFFVFIVVVSQVSPVEYTGPYGPSSKLIDDVTQYSRITEDELKAIKGEPATIEPWSIQTKYGKIPAKILTYDADKAHYEFVIIDNSVVRATLYSYQYWVGTDIPFTYNEIEDIKEMFNIIPGEYARTKDNNINYIISPVNNKIAEVRIVGLDKENKAFDLIKFTYDQRYFS